LHEKELYHALDASQMLFMANRASDRNFTRGVRRPILGHAASGALVEICIACWYSNQNIDETFTIQDLYID